jgi:galacturan 1,4-alpha-galacturonidase
MCIVPPSNNDASPAILQAAKRCNNGGTAVFLPFPNYIIASPLNLTFLKAIDFAILGTITLKDDVVYWQTHGWVYQFQTAFLFWRFGALVMSETSLMIPSK